MMNKKIFLYFCIFVVFTSSVLAVNLNINCNLASVDVGENIICDLILTEEQGINVVNFKVIPPSFASIVNIEGPSGWMAVWNDDKTNPNYGKTSFISVATQAVTNVGKVTLKANTVGSEKLLLIDFSIKRDGILILENSAISSALLTASNPTTTPLEVVDTPPTTTTPVVDDKPQIDVVCGDNGNIYTCKSIDFCPIWDVTKCDYGCEGTKCKPAGFQTIDYDCTINTDCASGQVCNKDHKCVTSGITTDPDPYVPIEVAPVDPDKKAFLNKMGEVYDDAEKGWTTTLISKIANIFKTYFD